MKRHALFVGVDNYQDTSISKLNFPSEDADELSSVFKHSLKFNRVEKLLNPGRATDIVDALKELRSGLEAGDLLLFFFAGHGFRVGDHHVLVCAKDEFGELEDEDAGLKVGRLKKCMRGAWDSMLILDACQNDIRTTRSAESGIAARDLALIHNVEDGADEERGLQIVVTACSEGQKALEVAGLKHGLFSSAFLGSVIGFADKRARLDLEALRIDLGKRMDELISRYSLAGRQTPLFTMPTNANGIVLFDGALPDVREQVAWRSEPGPASAPAQPAPGAFVVPSTAKTVKCPICGRRHREDSGDIFECRVCHRDFLCIGHFDGERNACGDCAGKLAAEEKARAAAERRAQEAARRAREEAERKTREEAERKARAAAERRAREEAEREAKAEGRFAGDTRKVEIAPGVEMEFVWVAPGSFSMGSDYGYAVFKKLVQRVTLTKGYWMGKYEVTQVEWRSVMWKIPVYFKGDRFPVANVTWNDCQEFVGKVNGRLKAKGEELRVRLPTEAEWEFASRGGTKSKGYKYSGSDDIGKVAWYKDNSGGEKHAVGTKGANELGIHDMSGNVWEWCADWYGGYASGAVIDPTGPVSGDVRVLRGGCWYFDASYCLSADRFGVYPGFRYNGLGFRLAASAGQ